MIAAVRVLLCLAALYSTSEGACQLARESSICQSKMNNLRYVLPPSAVSVIEHPVSVSVSSGSTVTFNCSTDAEPVIVNSAPYISRILWRFNGSVLSVNELGQIVYPSHWSVNSHETYSQLTVLDVSSTDHGYYECVVGDGLYRINDDTNSTFATFTVSKRAWLNRQQETGSEVAPMLSESNRVKEVHRLNGFTKTFRAMCNVTGPNQTLYWYKDGRDITSHSSGGQLEYSVQEDLYGVYQCFVENSAGSDYLTYRVLEQGYSNPPNNFSCRAVDQPDNPYKPKLVLSWSPPALNLLEDTEYSYTIFLKGDFEACFEIDSGTCAEVNLNVDDPSLECSVFVETDSQEFDSALATVEVNTIIQRRYEQDAVRQLSVTCPTADDNGAVVLPDPNVGDRFIACLSSLQLWGVCLYGDRPAGNEMLQPLVLNSPRDLRCNIQRDYSLPEVASQPAGAVCLFGGSYTYIAANSGDVLIVPTATCTVEPEQELKSLWVNCSEQVTVVSLHEKMINVSGRCVTTTGQKLKFEPVALSMDQEWTPSDNLTLNSICTFYTVNETTPPVQCIVGSPPLPRPTPPEPTSTIPPSTPSQAVSTEPAGGLVKNIPVYVWVIVSVFVTIVVFVAMVIFMVYVVVWCRRYRQKKDKDHLHDLAKAVERQLDSPEDPPVDPYPVTHFKGSSLSIHTDIDHLYDDRFYDNRGPHTPTMLIDKFFGCHDNGLAPSPQIVTLLMTSTEEFMADSGEYVSGSSGYSSAHTDSGDYYQKRLDEVTECNREQTELKSLDEQSSNRYVTEYFEPDSELEGYVHMVPYKSR